MKSPNISVVISPADTLQVKSHIEEIKNLLSFLINLNEDQKRSLFKMGSKSVSFVQKALQIAKNHPNILPSDFDVSEFEKDVLLSSGLTDIEIVTTPLAEGIRDTLLAVGSEAMNEANTVYKFVKIAAKTDTNMKEIRDQLSQRFAAQGNKSPKVIPPK